MNILLAGSEGSQVFSPSDVLSKPKRSIQKYTDSKWMGKMTN